MIRIENLHMRYRSDMGEVHAVRGISLTVNPGQFYTMLGPSGCGKTTTGLFLFKENLHSPLQAGHRHGFSILCHLAPHDGIRQRRLPAPGNEPQVFKEGYS